MRSAPKMDLSGVMPSRQDVVELFRSVIRQRRIAHKARKLLKKMPKGRPPMNPLMQHPALRPGREASRIESASSDEGNADPSRRGSARTPSPRHPVPPAPAPSSASSVPSSQTSLSRDAEVDASASDAVGDPSALPDAAAQADRQSGEQDLAAEYEHVEVSEPAPVKPRFPASLLPTRGVPAMSRPSSAGKLPNTLQGDSTSPSGQPAAGRRRSSAWKSAETQVEEAATALGADRRKTSGNAPKSVNPPPPGEIENYPCYMCGMLLGRERGEGLKVERLAYLPCGQAFGHECLFNWLKDTGALKYCPDCGVTMRHACEHLTTPTESPPDTAFTDAKAIIMPRNYEFCLTRKGLRLHESIERAADLLRVAEARKVHRPKSPLNFTHEVYRKLLAHLILRAEKRLDKHHKAWWAVRWATLSVKK